jgi:hypothetical protein
MIHLELQGKTDLDLTRTFSNFSVLQCKTETLRICSVLQWKTSIGLGLARHS